MADVPDWMIPEQVASVRLRPWHLEKWQPGDAWRRPGNSSMWTNKPTDEGEWEKVPGGWDHEHCRICFGRIFASADVNTSMAFHDGLDWLCQSCHEVIFSGKKLH